MVIVIPDVVAIVLGLAMYAPFALTITKQVGADDHSPVVKDIEHTPVPDEDGVPEIHDPL